MTDDDRETSSSGSTDGALPDDKRASSDTSGATGGNQPVAEDGRSPGASGAPSGPGASGDPGLPGADAGGPAPDAVAAPQTGDPGSRPDDPGSTRSGEPDAAPVGGSATRAGEPPAWSGDPVVRSDGSAAQPGTTDDGVLWPADRRPSGWERPAGAADQQAPGVPGAPVPAAASAGQSAASAGEPVGDPGAQAGPPAGGSAGPPGDAAPAGRPGAGPWVDPISGATQQIPVGYPQSGPPPGAQPGMPWQQPAGYGPYGPVAARPGRGKRWLAAGAAAVALVLGGGVVGGVTVHALDGNSPVESPVATDAVSAKGGSLAGMVQRVRPSVVSLTVKTGSEKDTGSGVIIRSDGMVLTNNHVVAPLAASGGSLTVTMSDGKQVPAEVVGTDPAGDLAVVQAKGQKGLRPATLGNSDKLRVGDGVVAIGSPLGLQGSVTEGIVSALHRNFREAPEQQQRPQQDNPFNFGQRQQESQQQQSVTITDAIQTDASINPGNSGGPLINMAGQVIGLNTAIRSNSGSGQAGSIGIGFAIPINTAKSTADTLMKGKKVKHPLFGVSVRDAVPGDASGSGRSTGALVAAVTDGGPADKAGLRKGDVITKVGHERIDSADALVAAVDEHQPGDKITVTYTRDGGTKTATATLASK